MVSEVSGVIMTLQYYPPFIAQGEIRLYIWLDEVLVSRRIEYRAGRMLNVLVQDTTAIAVSDY